MSSICRTGSPRSVVGAIEPTMRKAEIERARRKPVENLDAYDLYLRALPHVYAMRPDENLLGLDLARQGDRTRADLCAGVWPMRRGAMSNGSRGDGLRRRRRCGDSNRAGSSGACRRQRRCGCGGARRLCPGDGGAGLSRRSRRRAPRARAKPRFGIRQLHGGDRPGFRVAIREDALALMERAMALGPLDPSFYMYLMVAGWAHLFSGRPAEALELAERSASLNPDWDSTYWGLIPAYVQLDRLPEARAALIKYLSLAPGMTVSGLRQLLPIRNPASLEMVLDGLRKAGLPGFMSTAANLTSPRVTGWRVSRSTSSTGGKAARILSGDSSSARMARSSCTGRTR